MSNSVENLKRKSISRRNTKWILLEWITLFCQNVCMHVYVFLQHTRKI